MTDFNQDDGNQPDSDNTAATRALVTELHDGLARVTEAVGSVIVGQGDARELLLITLLTGGHCLITGLPGTAKTLMVQSLAAALGLATSRIQFTPDLMPSDVTGTDIIDQDPATGERAWRFVGGPVFTNILLADEVNRTPPKTQSALLEAMAEGKVTVRGTTHELPAPFMVLATQNPIELEGTYPLPEAQLDRFMFNVILDYLSADEELTVVERNTLGAGLPRLTPCLDGHRIAAYQQLVRQVPVSDAMNRYAVNLVRASRPGDGAPAMVNRFISYGASIRAATHLAMGGRARALIRGRYHVTGDDIRALAKPVLRHRLQTSYLAESENVTTDAVIDDIIGSVRE